jgi:hypothetical protein
MSKKSSKNVSKKASAPKRASKKASAAKKSSKKSTKRSSKQRGGDPLAAHRAFVKYVLDDLKKKGGPVGISFASSYRAEAKKKLGEGASQDDISVEAKKIYLAEKNSGQAEKRYQRVEKDMADRKAAKKAAKANSSGGKRKVSKKGSVAKKSSKKSSK